MSLLAVTSCCPLDGALAGGQALSLYIFKSQLWGKSPPSQAHQDMHEDYLHMHGFFCQSLLAKHGHGYPRCSCSMISQQEEQKRQCTMCTAHPPNRQASLSDTIGLYDGWKMHFSGHDYYRFQCKEPTCAFNLNFQRRKRRPQLVG